MSLDEATKAAIVRALDSHNFCGHEEAQLCYTMTLIEAEIRGGHEFSEEEIEASKVYIADQVLEGLILKGVVEVTGIDEDGEFSVGLTEVGEQAYDDMTREEN